MLKTETWIPRTDVCVQVAETLGDKVKVLKIDVDENPELSSQLKVRDYVQAWNMGRGPQRCVIVPKLGIWGVAVSSLGLGSGAVRLSVGQAGRWAEQTYCCDFRVRPCKCRWM